MCKEVERQLQFTVWGGDDCPNCHRVIDELQPYGTVLVRDAQPLIDGTLERDEHLSEVLAELQIQRLILPVVTVRIGQGALKVLSSKQLETFLAECLFDNVV